MTGKVLAACFLTVAAVSAATVSIDPTVTNVDVGSTFSLNVDITDITDLYAFQFDIGFDPTVLSANSVSEGPFLSSGGGTTLFIPGTIDNGSGLVSFTADALTGPISGVSTGATPGVLATLQFTALSTGTSPITLSNIMLLDSNLSDIEFTSQDGSVNVAPEPHLMFPLFAALLILLTVHARRRRATLQ